MRGSVRVSGLRELQRAFRKMEGDLGKELRGALIDAAEPVKNVAEQYALGGIRNMPRSPEWADMRIGVSGRAVVYIVPRRRGGGGSPRPNLKGLLQREMDTAVDAKQSEVVDGVGRMIDKLSRTWGD